MNPFSLSRRVAVALVVVVTASFAMVARAQQSTDDVIYLKDGSILKGKIFEEVPAKYIKLQTPDGKIREYKMKAIKSITRTPQANTETIEAADKDPAVKGGAVIPPAQSSPPLAPQQTKPLQLTPQAGPMVFAERKSPTAAFILSFLVPGMGQFYNGQYLKGGIQTGAFVAGIGVMLAWGRANSYSSEPYTDYSYYGTYTYYHTWDEDYTTAWMYIGAGVAVSSWIWSMIDAPISANHINDEHFNNSYGHMIEMGSDRYVVGIDVGMQERGLGARAVVHLP
ncbi:MAG TPA: DUF5683 domain-containing protein [Bacteroidota bacterium]|nr:DUF5683 domain-containing protein [Bacteroidota bacterium]